MTAERSADNLRILIATMVEKAKSGHPGGAMGAADFIEVLYSEFMCFDPNDMTWAFRDRFFLDPGHMSAMLYGQLALFGKYSMEELSNFRQWKSPTPGHPEVDQERGIENTSGPLGQGHAMGVGAAIAERFLCERFGEWMAHKTYAFISDGGIQEEISQGAGRIAGFLGLSNLIMFFDSNDVQLSTRTEDVTTEDTAKKYESWGWAVQVIDGHDRQQIKDALAKANQETSKPTLIIGKTVMGKGALTQDGGTMEGSHKLHGMPLSKAGVSFENTITGLGGDPENPMVIFPDVSARYDQIVERKIKEVDVKKKAEVAWRNTNPSLSEKLDGFLSRSLPDIDFKSIAQANDIATRAASSTVLSYFADHVENLVVASADLSDSDKTDGFLKKTSAFKKGDFSGAFLQAGVSEFSMAAIANGMALHGGIIPVVGTFFVFSDYMKPAARLSALMQLPVIYLWTHDAFRVGEDGPTHQPIEHEAQIRLLEELRNHAGKRSLLALRPADAEETTVAWKLALETDDRPTALILSRQNIKDLPPQTASAYRQKEAYGAEQGAYIIRASKKPTPDIILVANGSEVSTLMQAVDELSEKHHIDPRVVSIISEGLFRDQSIDYQKSVIADGVPIFGLTAGLPSTLSGIVGDRGFTHGLDHFGYSAPASKLDVEFGFTPESVVQKVVAYLEGK